MKLIVSDGAKADFSEIWDFIAADNRYAADRLIKDIVSKFQMLVAMPRAGRLHEELGTHVRVFPVGRYIILYRLSGDDLVVLRVLHSSRDINVILGEEN